MGPLVPKSSTLTKFATRVYAPTIHKMLTLSLALLTILVASSASGGPINIIEDSSSIASPSDLDDGALVFRDDEAVDEGEAQRNYDTVFGEEEVMRHIAKRSPLPPFDPFSKSLKLIKKSKKLFKKGGKLLKISPFLAPIEQLFPLALAGGAGGLAASAFGLPALGLAGGTGGLGTGLGLASSTIRNINGLPFIG